MRRIVAVLVEISKEPKTRLHDRRSEGQRGKKRSRNEEGPKPVLCNVPTAESQKKLVDRDVYLPALIGGGSTSDGKHLRRHWGSEKENPEEPQ